MDANNLPQPTPEDILLKDLPPDLIDAMIEPRVRSWLREHHEEITPEMWAAWGTEGPPAPKLLGSELTKTTDDIPAFLDAQRYFTMLIANGNTLPQSHGHSLFTEDAAVDVLHDLKLSKSDMERLGRLLLLTGGQVLMHAGYSYGLKDGKRGD